ncbi:MAG: hypothetical protein ACOX52_15340 [Verrucomicrobiota bacterium]
MSRHRKMPGFSCPHPITRSFDTDSGSDPDPELASPRNFSNDLQQKTHPKPGLFRRRQKEDPTL